MELLEPRILGITDGKNTITQGYNAIAIESSAMAMQARRRIRILSYQLESRIYNQTDFIEAAKQLAIRHPKTEIQILIQDNGLIIREGHQLIELAQRLSSSFIIKKIAKEYQDVLRSFLLVDEAGFVFRPYWTDPKVAFSHYNGAAEAKEYHYQFQKIWDKSEVDLVLRRL